MALGLYLIYLVWKNKNIFKTKFKKFLKLEEVKKSIKIALIFIFSSWIFGTIFATLKGGKILSSIKNVIWFGDQFTE